MIYLITGGSGSGKSEYAEALVMSLPASRRYYVATMAVFGREGEAKVQRHQALRRGKGFITLERQRKVGRPLPGLEPGEDGAGDSQGAGVRAETVLLECVSNLAANEMFGSGREEARNPYALARTPAEELAGTLAEDIRCLGAQAKDMVIVTNEVASDGILYEPGTMEYIRVMGSLNRRLAEMADQVVEVVYGIPVWIKGMEQ